MLTAVYPTRHVLRTMRHPYYIHHRPYMQLGFRRQDLQDPQSQSLQAASIGAKRCRSWWPKTHPIASGSCERLRPGVLQLSCDREDFLEEGIPNRTRLMITSPDAPPWRMYRHYYANSRIEVPNGAWSTIVIEFVHAQQPKLNKCPSIFVPSGSAADQVSLNL